MLILIPSDLRPASEELVNFDHLQENQVNRYHTKNKSISARTQSISTPRTKKQVNFDPNTKTKSISIPQTNVKLFSTLPQKSSQFDPNSFIKSISMPRHKKQVNFDAKNKSKYFPTLTQKTVNSDPSSQLRPSEQKTRQVRPQH